MFHSFFKCQHTALVSLSFAAFLTSYFIFIIVLLIPQSTYAEVARVEQPIKNAVVRNDVIETMFNVQCSKIIGISSSIEKLSVSVTPDPNASAPLAFKAVIYKYTEGPNSPPALLRRSEVAYTGPKGVQNDVVFNFNSPIDVDGDICSNPGAYFSVYVSYAGTSTSNRTADFNGSATAGMYYVFNGHVLLNSSPILEPIGPKIVSEDVTLNFAASAIDPDNNTITYSATNLPIGATLNPTTGEFTWTPGYTDAGTYEVTFTATENTPEALFDSETITITVTNTNRAPELTTIGNQTISEGATLQFTVSATDPDNDTITLSATNLPTGATFTPSTGLFYWNTDFDEAGNYADIEFTATDNGIPMELDVELITITVGDVNRMPELSNPGPQVVLEEDTLSFTVSATDPDNDTVTLSASNLPTGATFNPTTGSFNWTPSLADAGVYTVTITATDNGTPVESATIDVVITVGDNPTPTEQAEDLVEIVITIDIPQNIENSYLANLHKVKQFILAGQITAALNQLQAFINKVQQDYNQNRLSQEEYDALIEAAENLMDDLMN